MGLVGSELSWRAHAALCCPCQRRMTALHLSVRAAVADTEGEQGAMPPLLEADRLYGL